MELPRNLYKSPGSIIVNANKSYDTILVNTEEEYKVGIEKGYIDSFSDALNDEITGKFEVIEPVKKVVIEPVKEPIKKVDVKEEKEPENFDDF